VKNYEPYKYWTREKMFENIKESCLKTNNNDLVLMFKNMVFDCRWNPTLDYNGCNFIQDRLHIFPACFEHDYNCLVVGWSNKNDLLFMKRCLQFGSTPYEAKRNYVGVRLGWLFWFKWKKMLENRNK
jgi:hypothetical protein